MATKTFQQMVEDLRNSGNVDLSTLDAIMKDPTLGQHITMPTYNFNLPTYNAEWSGQGAAPDPSTPLWKKLLGGLDALGNGVRSMAVNQQERAKERGDNAQIMHFSDILPDLKAGWMGLTHPIKNQHTGEDILSNMGWQDKKGFGMHDIAGFGLDVALDPLTYLTFGGGAVAKAGLRATAEVGAELAMKEGVQAGKTAAQTAGNVYAKKLAEHLANGVDPQVAEKFAGKEYTRVKDAIENAGKAARAKAQNDLISLNVPFTNQTAGILRKPEFLKITENGIGKTGVPAANHMLEQLGHDSEASKSAFLKKTYGIDNVEHMNIQQFDHLKQAVKDFQEGMPIEQAINRGGIENLFTGAIPAGAKHINDFAPGSLGAGTAQHAASPAAKIAGELPGPSMADLGQRASRAAKAPKSVDGAIVNDFTPRAFVQDAGGRSALGRMIPGRDALNPRSFGRKGEGVVNQAAGNLWDARNKIRGLNVENEKVLKTIDKSMEKLTHAEREAIPYLIENEIPKDFNMKGMDRAKMKEVASNIKSILDKMGNEEVKAGVLEQMRNNYFPHVLKYDEAKLAQLREKYKDNPELQQLFGGSSANKFNRERTSFQSLAQADNYVAGLEKKLNAGGLSEEEIAKLQSEIDDVKGLFERDPVKVLQARSAEHIKSTVMKDLHTDFKKSGLLWEPGDHMPKGFDSTHFKKLDGAEAKALGLKNGSWIHNDVFEGLKRAEGIFRDGSKLESVMKVTDSVTNIWRSLVTTLMPSHYINNAIGNVFNMAIAGVKPRAYGETTNLFLRLKRGKVTASDLDILHEAAMNGVFGHGFTSEFTRKGMKATNKLEKTEAWVRDAKPAKIMRELLGEKPDNFFRMTLYMSARKGMTEKAAAAEVRKYLFNYNELTEGDRAIRALVPFWNWMKRNTPLQIQKLIQTPRYYQTYKRLQDQMNEGVDRPAWGDAYTKVPGLNQLINPHLPLDSLTEMQNPLKMVLSGMNPVFKDPIEIGMNQSMFTDRPIDYKAKYGQGHDPQAWLDYALAQTGVLGKAVNLAGYGNSPWQVDLQAILTGKPVVLDNQK